jgi:hypothetical protein
MATGEARAEVENSNFFSGRSCWFLSMLYVVWWLCSTSFI